jgi:flagellar FliL protein
MSDTKTAPEEEAPAKGGKKKLLLILAVLLVAGAGAAYFFLFSGSGEPAPPEPGELVTLDPVAVNLAGGGYLKIGVALQFTADAAGGEEKPNTAKAADLIISTFSQASPTDVSGARDALKEALQQKIIEAYEGDVMGIYYTEYVTQ